MACLGVIFVQQTDNVGLGGAVSKKAKCRRVNAARTESLRPACFARSFRKSSNGALSALTYGHRHNQKQRKERPISNLNCVCFHNLMGLVSAAQTGKTMAETPQGISWAMRAFYCAATR